MVISSPTVTWVHWSQVPMALGSQVKWITKHSSKAPSLQRILQPAPILWSGFSKNGLTFGPIKSTKGPEPWNQPRWQQCHVGTHRVYSKRSFLIWGEASVCFVGLGDILHKTSVPSSTQLCKVPASPRTERVLSKLNNVVILTEKCPGFSLPPTLPEASRRWPGSPHDFIPSRRKPMEWGVGVERYFQPSTTFPPLSTCRKTDHFVCYTLGNQFQSPGDFLGLLSTFILLFLIYSFDLHNLNILSSF